MRTVVHEGLKNPLVVEAARNFQNPADLESAVRRVFVYRDEKEEVIRGVFYMLSDWLYRQRVEGDCDDASVFLAAFLVAMGCIVRFVAIAYDGRPGFRHVFVEWSSGGPWYRMDVTVPAGVIHREDERMVLYVL